MVQMLFCRTSAHDVINKLISRHHDIIWMIHTIICLTIVVLIATGSMSTTLAIAHGDMGSARCSSDNSGSGSSGSSSSGSSGSGSSGSSDNSGGSGGGSSSDNS